MEAQLKITILSGKKMRCVLCKVDCVMFTLELVCLVAFHDYDNSAVVARRTYTTRIHTQNARGST